MFGKIKFFHSKRGFGFIRTSPTGDDIFFHCHEFDGAETELVKGASVEFDLGQNNGKTEARNIRLLHAPEPETTEVSGGR